MRIFLEYLKVGLWMLPIILPALWLLPRLSKRYAARVSYVIWLVLAVRLLIPWNLTLPQETAPIHVAISEEQANEWVQAKFNPVQAPPKAEGTAAAAQKQTQPQAEPLQPLQIGFALWLAGVLFFALRTAVSVFRMKALLRRWEKEPSAEAKAFFAETAGKTQPRLMVCPVLESPMAVGLFRTTVYLPHEHYTAQELEMIFRHELIHWRRKDLWYKLLLLAARSIHWFNPLVWRMAKRAERDLEISCDSMAVQGRDAAYRKAYGLMILQEAERSIEKQAALTTCFTDGKRALQERLVEIMNQSKRKKGMALVSVMLVLTLTCGCLISCGKDEKASESTQDTAASQGTLTAEQRKLTERWAEALSDRDGKIRYKEMGKAAKAQFIAEQKALGGEDKGAESVKRGLELCHRRLQPLGGFLYHRGARKCSHDYLYHAGQPACLLHHEGAFEIRGGKRKNRCRRLSHLQFLLGGQQGASHRFPCRIGFGRRHLGLSFAERGRLYFPE